MSNESDEKQLLDMLGKRLLEPYRTNIDQISIESIMMSDEIKVALFKEDHDLSTRNTMTLEDKEIKKLLEPMSEPNHDELISQLYDKVAQLEDRIKILEAPKSRRQRYQENDPDWWMSRSRLEIKEKDE